MTAPILGIDNLGKAYRRYRNEWSRIGSWFGIRVRPTEEHWVLRNISFSIAPGEALGIVGQNGAGKSTLLKLITGTTRPSEGRVSVQGRVAAILELGMGFNPELTGRQNVYHAAGLMGFSRDQISDVMPQIEKFAEVGEYFDRSVRTYSSGMQVRVAFAVATAFRPEILIVDEALSVGDAYFQHKSFDRIRTFQDQGTTLLIVSHDRGSIQSLCNRVILLDQGQLIIDDEPERVMDYYNALLADRGGKTLSQQQQEDGRTKTISGTGEAKIESIGLFNHQGNPVEVVLTGARIELRLRVRVLVDIPRLVLGFVIKDRLGQYIYGTNTHHTDQAVHQARAGQVIHYRIALPSNLGPGSYAVATALTDSDTHLACNYEWNDLALVFNVNNLDKPFFVGNTWLPTTIEVRFE